MHTRLHPGESRPMPHTLEFLQLDVFADRLCDGNPLAVVIGAEALDSTTMQDLARWTNLSETAFLLPPTQAQADYRVRIFTPRQELPFAGHPSVGSAYAAIEAGVVDALKRELVQECAAGLLPVRVVGQGAARIIHVQAPPATLDDVDGELCAQLATALQVNLARAQTSHVNNGPHWIVCDLIDAAPVRALTPDMGALAKLSLQHDAVGVAVFGRESSGDAAMAVRAFCPADGIAEDPVTGSANAAIMAWLGTGDDSHGYGLNYRASQGREIGRNGFVEVARDPVSGAVSIGGACVIGIRGTLQLPPPR